MTDEQILHHIQEAAERASNAINSYCVEQSINELEGDVQFNINATILTILLADHIKPLYDAGEFGIINDLFNELKKITIEMASQMHECGENCESAA